MSHPRAWILVLSQLCLTLANPIYAPQFLAGGTGRNIRHLPCVSLRSGETGVCMFAFTCVKANGTHLGTCIDRFYFGSCCKLNEEADVFPQENTIEEGPASSSFVTTDSSIESNDIPDYFTRPKPIVPMEKQPSSSTLSSTSQTALVTTQSVQSKPTSTTTEIPNIVTKRPYFSTPYTTTQPPMDMTTFQTLHNYSQGSSSFSTSHSVSQSSPNSSTKPQKPTSPESTTVSTTKGGSTRPRPTPSTSSGTRRPVVTETITKKPSSVSATKPTSSRKPVTPSTSRPLSSPSTTERIPPSTRFPPRNATTTRPVHTTTRKPASKKPAVTTKRPSSGTRRPTTTPRPSSTVAATAKPSSVTAKPFTTSVKVTQTIKPPITSTQGTVPTSGTKPSSTLGSSTDSATSQRPITKRPVVSSIDDKIVTTARPTTSKPLVTSSKPRPSSKPTKTSTTTSVRPTTTKVPSRPQHQSTEKIKPSPTTSTSSSSSSRPSTSRPSTPRPPTSPPSTSRPATSRPSTSRPPTARPTAAPSKRPRPTEKPTKPTKPTKQTKPTRPSSATTPSISTTLELPSTTQATTQSVTSTVFNGTTLTNEILPPKITEPTVTTQKVTQTTHSPGLVTWSSNSDEEVTKASEISSTTPKTAQETPDPQWSPITTPDGWIMIESLTTEKPAIGEASTKRPKPTKIPTTSVEPTSGSATTESVTTPRPTIPTTPSTIATVTTATDLPVPMETLNMSDYKQVCGRRLFPESRIVGGDDSSFGKWPWQISLRQWRSKSYLHKCGAALLNENWAITAAHCVENVPPSDLLLRLGEHDLANEDEPYGFQERRVQIVASHPQFDPRTFEYDLALLRFYEPLEPFQPNLLPICLPDDDENYVGHSAYVTGWGRLYEDGILPSVLQEVSVPVINNTVCEGMYRSAGYIEHIPHIFICAGWRKGGYDSCEGDSGGPMVIRRPRDKRWILAGVISWGIGCAEPNQPGVYTRISEFREWINQILQF